MTDYTPRHTGADIEALFLDFVANYLVSGIALVGVIILFALFLLLTRRR